MKGTTSDRGDVIHFAGFHRLSPALDAGGKPAFSAQSADGLARCGWEGFFDALARHHLALERDPEDAASARFVPAGGATPHADPPRAGLGEAIAHARRFWAALCPPAGKAG